MPHMHLPEIYERAIALHQKAHRTDPYAGKRMRLYLIKGYENPQEVIKEAKRLLGIRE